MVCMSFHLNASSFYSIISVVMSNMFKEFYGALPPPVTSCLFMKLLISEDASVVSGLDDVYKANETCFCIWQYMRTCVYAITIMPPALNNT